MKNKKPLELWTDMFMWYGYPQNHAEESAAFALRLLNKDVQRMRAPEISLVAQQRRMMFTYLKSLGLDNQSDTCYNGSIPGNEGTGSAP